MGEMSVEWMMGEGRRSLASENRTSDAPIAGIIQRKPGIAQLNTMYDRYIFITHY